MVFLLQSLCCAAPSSGVAAELRVATEVNNPRRLHTQNLHTTLALSSHSPHRSFNKSSQHVPPESSRIFTMPSQESSENHQRIFRYSSQNLQRIFAESAHKASQHLHRTFREL